MKQHDDSSKGSFKSGGQRIDDHTSWMGKPGKDMVMPQGVKTKSESSAEGAGSLSRYEDTTEAIRASQKMSDSKIKAYPNKPFARQ